MHSYPWCKRNASLGAPPAPLVCACCPRYTIELNQQWTNASGAGKTLVGSPASPFLAGGGNAHDGERASNIQLFSAPRGCTCSPGGLNPAVTFVHYQRACGHVCRFVLFSGVPFVCVYVCVQPPSDAIRSSSVLLWLPDRPKGAKGTV